MADDDLDILAWTMLGEAGGEGMQGMADVGHVVLNRLNAGRYGGSISEVALAPKQFSTWNSGNGGNDPKGRYPKDSPEFRRAREIAAQVVAGTIPGPPGKPLDYNADNISPYWASSKSQNGTYTRNGHTFYPSVPVPPGELPEVATALSTVPMPRIAPTPVTPTPSAAAIRQMTSPSGGNTELQTALDRVATRERNRVTPASAEERVTARNRQFWETPPDPFNGDPLTPSGGQVVASIPTRPSTSDAARRAALSMGSNTTYSGTERGPLGDPLTPARGPVVASIPTMPGPVGQPPTVRPVATTTIRPSASDKVRGNPMQIKEVATTIASIPTRPQVSASDLARGKSGAAIPDRLLASPPGLPALYGGFAPQQVAQMGTAFPPLPNQPRPVMVANAAPKVAPTPFPRPGFMPQVATQLAVKPMPPMPIARPGIGGPALPMPPAPLRVVVNGGNVQQPPARSTWAPAGYTNDGSGRITSNDTGGVYYERHIRK